MADIGHQRAKKGLLRSLFLSCLTPRALQLVEGEHISCLLIFKLVTFAGLAVWCLFIDMARVCLSLPHHQLRNT